MPSSLNKVFLAAGKRSPFARVDGPLAASDPIALSAHVLKHATGDLRGPVDGVIWGTVAQRVSISNLAREAAHDAGLDLGVPAHSVIMACSTSMVAAFDAAGYIQRGLGHLMVAGGTELMSRVQIGLAQDLSDTIRRAGQARSFKDQASAVASLRPKDIRLDIPSVTNRVSGKSMGEHAEETAQEWKIARGAQDEWALLSHQRAVAAAERGFFDDEIVESWGLRKDAFPRADTSLEKLAKLKPAFDRTSGHGSITAGNASPLTDGAASVLVCSAHGLGRLPAGTAAVELVDYEVCAVDAARHGLLMAPAFGLPRLLARNALTYQDVALYEIHEAFAAQVLNHFAAFQSERFLREFGVERGPLGEFPVDRVNPNGGSLALGHPFGATGARILTQAVRELAEMRPGSHAVVSICADGGLGTVALLRRPE